MASGRSVKQAVPESLKAGRLDVESNRSTFRDLHTLKIGDACDLLFQQAT